MYYIVYCLLYLVSLLPLRILYVLSDAIYGLVYYIIGYRRKIVLDNITVAFPEKSLEERTKIAKKFYRNLIDTFIETIKMISAGDKFLRKRISGNWEIINQLFEKGVSCQVHAGHTFNWEWGQRVAAMHISYKFMGVYMPISNPIFNRLFIDLRARNGTILLPANKMKESMQPHINTQYLLALAVDQNPSVPSNAHWLNFFGKPTPFVTGPEKAAKSGNIPVVFAHFEKSRRGYYKIVFEVANENPQLLADGDLTLQFARHLEGVIRNQPDMWLWSHRRWKHEWKHEYQPLWLT